MEVQGLFFGVVDDEEWSRPFMILREDDGGRVIWKVHVSNDPAHLQRMTNQLKHWKLNNQGIWNEKQFTFLLFL